MAIVPSGKRRLMKLQQQYQVTDQEGDATQSEVTNDGAGGGSQEPAFNTEKLKQDMTNKSVTGPQYGEEDYQAAVSGGKLDSSAPSKEEPQQGDDELGKKGSNIRGYVFQLLEELGAPPRLIMENPDTFFQGKKDLDTGTITGSYILPSFTNNKKVTQDDAERIAHQIGAKFGLSQSISPQGSNYKVDFRTKELQMQEDFGTSLQELVKQKGGAGGGKNQGQFGGMSRAARTQSEMIKEGRSELANKLRQLGFGGDK
jgi:hypothetical protein